MGGSQSDGGGGGSPSDGGGGGSPSDGGGGGPDEEKLSDDPDIQTVLEHIDALNGEQRDDLMRLLPSFLYEQNLKTLAYEAGSTQQVSAMKDIVDIGPTFSET